MMAAAMLLAACSPKAPVKEPSAQEFAPYVKAFTGGMVAQDAELRVDLTQDVQGGTEAASLFSFEPPVAGTARWNSASSASFLPAEGALKPGKRYKASFHLEKLFPGAPCFDYPLLVKSSARSGVIAIEDNGRPFHVQQLALKDGRIDVVLSKAPANAQLRGLVEVEGAARSYTQVQDSLLSVFFEGRSGDLTLTLDAGLKSADGVTLGSSFRHTFPQQEQVPAVEIPLKGSILPEKDKFWLPFRAVNLSAVEVMVVKIYEKNVLMFLQDNNLASGGSELRRSGRLVWRGDVQLDPSKDLHQWNEHSIDLSGLMKKEPGAIYRIKLRFRQDQSLYGDKAPMVNPSAPGGKPGEADQATWDKASSYYWDNDYDWEHYSWEEADDPTKASFYMDSDRFPVVQLLSSDIGLMAEYAAGPEFWVTATDLVTGGPLSGAQIEVYDYQLQRLAKGKTDSKGLASFTLEHKPFAVVAKAGGSTAYLKTTGGEERSLSRFDVGGESLQKGLKAFIYGERGVWRPGDTLHVNLLLNKPLPEGHPITLELYTPEGQFHTRQVQKGTDGFFCYDIPTKESDPTGYWSATFKAGGSVFQKTLHIESIKPNRLKISTQYPEVLEAGKRLQARIGAQWLSGGAAGGARAHAQLTLRRMKGSPFKDFADYSFNNPASQFQEAQSSLFESWLDGGGNADVPLTLPEAAHAPGMLEAFVLTSVEEKGGDESFTTQTLPFSPYSAYVGIKNLTADYLETDKHHKIGVAVVDPKGRPVKGHALEYALYKVGWNWWWDSPDASLDAYVNGSSVKLVRSGKLTSATQDVFVDVYATREEWGRYLLLVQDSVSGHISGKTFLVDWPDYEGRASRRDPEALTMLSFSTDKSAYAVGDKATVYIPAAEGAQALVSLENGSGVLQREWVKLSGSDTPWSFTVTPEMAPNIYVNITLLQPYGHTGNDLPIRLYGVQRVLVENPASKLQPLIQMPEKLHPEEAFTIKVSERSGKAMTYTLALVDEGLLDLTAFKTPDPWSRMFRPEALGVNTWDLYDNVIGARSGKLTPLGAIGGDEDAVRSARQDRRFNPVVIALKPRTLKAGGTDVVTLKLPQYVGSVRVMVVAAHEGAFGSAEKTVPVQSPLMVISTLPRQIGCGEEFTLPVNVFALEEGVKEATVSVEADGPVKLLQTREKVRFDGPGDQLVYFRVKVADEEGVAQFKVSASGGSHKAGEELSVPVVNPNPLLTLVERLSLKAGESRRVNPQDRVQVTGYPAPDMQSLFTEMRDYSYDCSEQLSARGLVLVNLLPQLSEADAATARELLPELIARLYARQCADGGFSYWDGGQSDSWVSSMAGALLSQASKAGFEVNEGVVKAWTLYQQKLSQAYRVAGSSLFTQADEAFRLYSLAVAGTPSQAGMNRLREAGSLAPQAKWLLASAYALSGKASTAAGILDGAERDFPEYTPYNLTYGSATRDRFAALEALVLCDRMAEAVSMAQPLEHRRLSTQEAAFAALAYGRLWEKLPTKEVSTTLEDGLLTNTSSGPVYVTLSQTVRTSPLAASNGLSVEVKYVDAEGATVNPSALKQGTRFSAVIKVQSLQAGRDLENLALSFAVPSGWEIMNERMAGAAEGYDHKDIRDTAVRWYFALPAGRYKSFTVQLRAAYEGRYALPATVCEAMYEPTVNASTAAGVAAVKR